uniref:Uncharacterized protein n=1 Tax=Davidia involucrata TaxID=16924 RepID=A0A5B6YME1_DAVIN
MEEAEKMVAMKKACADIILSTAKEAATRIMASERKSLRFQQDLSFSKDEALRMLLQLKQMIDSKTTEAEITFLNKRRRIEAQLDEAEDNILDLRTELKQAQDQLDKVKSNHMQTLKGSIEKQDRPFYESTIHEKLTNSDPIISSSSDSGTKVVMTSEMKSAPLNQRILDSKCSTSAKQTAPSKPCSENFCVDNPDLASLVMRSKEHELYRNGCTQRIRAFERNLLDGQLPPSGDVDEQHFVIKSEPIINVKEQNIEICTAPSCKTEDVDGLEEVPINGRAYEDQPFKVRKMRRRKTRYRKAKANACRFHPCQPSSFLSHCKTYADNNDVKSGEGACTSPKVKAETTNLMETSSGEKMQHGEDQVLRVVRRSLRKRKAKYRDDIVTSCSSLPDQLIKPCQPCSFFSRCKTYAVNSDVKSGEDRSNTENEARIKTDMDTVSGSTYVTVRTKAVRKSGLRENATDKGTELIDEAVLVQDGDTAENSSVPNCKLNLEMDKVSLMLTDSDSNNAKKIEANNRAPSQAENNRLFMHTFSRKRKKEPLTNPDENTSNTMKRKVEEKQNGAPELHKSSLINESSRDTRRLVQVAR